MRYLLVIALLFGGAGLLRAADEKVEKKAATPAAVEEEDIRDRLGERFTSRGRGISFRPPLGGTEIKKAAIGVEIVRYVGADEKWSLNVSLMTFEKPTRLVSVDNPVTKEDESKSRPGIISQIVTQLLQNNVSTEILRQDVVNHGISDMGMIVARYTQGAQALLRQQAIIQRNDQLYYVLDF